MESEKIQYNLLKELLEEFRFLNKRIFWTDLIITFLLSWPLFFFAVFSEGPISYLSFIISVFAIYRGTIFIHEVVHFEKELSGFRIFFNLLFGWPNCFPAYLYTPHFFHHGKKTYGTKKDPEYMYLGDKKPITMIAPLIVAFILPIFHFIRFALVPLFYPIMTEKMKFFIFENFSTLVMDVKYKRRKRYPNELNQMVLNDLACCLYKWVPLLAIYYGYLPVKALVFYIIALYCSMVLNMYRAKFNHKYENPNTPMTDMGQLYENVTIEGSILSELWSPTALRFHTIHHVVQDIPYHNLKKAHEKLKRELPKDHPYFQTIEKSFFSAWKSHYKMLKNN